MASKINTYNPKKTLKEIINPTIKPVLIVLSVLSLILISAYGAHLLTLENISKAESAPPTVILNEKSQQKVVVSTTSRGASTPKQKVVAPKVKEEVSPADYSTIISDLSNDKIAKALPDSAKIVLKFYNFNLGARQWEKSYILGSDEIKEGDIEDKDIMIFVHSKYVEKIKSDSLCNVMKQAKENGDFGVETEKSKTALMWKYKGLISYKSCLGL